MKNERQWNDYKILTKNIEILPIDDICIDKAIKVYHDLKERNKLIELSDLLIAATGLSNFLPLATLNLKHFENITEIELVSSLEK